MDFASFVRYAFLFTHMCTPGIIIRLYKLVKGGVSQVIVLKLLFYTRLQMELVLFYFYYIFNTEYIIQGIHKRMVRFQS